MYVNLVHFRNEHNNIKSIKCSVIRHFRIKMSIIEYKIRAMLKKYLKNGHHSPKHNRGRSTCTCSCASPTHLNDCKCTAQIAENPRCGVVFKLLVLDSLLHQV